MALLTATVTAPPAYRAGGGSYTPGKFPCMSMSLTWAWGSEPATATVTYTSAAPVSTGASVVISGCGHTFYGVCMSDMAESSSGGQRRILEFSDNRLFLGFDLVYCAFNKVDDRLVNGRRVKRYWHILPANFNARRKTYTNAPLTAAQILEYIVGANKWVTVEDPWVCTYHADQVSYPVYDIDCLSGKHLKVVLQEISDQQGLVFTLMGGPYSLVWSRKGTGSAPSFPADSDSRVSGTMVSGNPTRIRVLGDRNLYQVLNIPMSPDWKGSWAQFYDRNILADWIYKNGTTRTTVNIGGTEIPAGTAYTAIGGDPEGIIAHQLALADALEITVGEFASRYGGALGGVALFQDYRKFAGRSRMDMPAVAYIQQILFRAFRLPLDFSISTPAGLVSAESLEISGRMLAQVTHDPTTGEMTPILDENPDGNGYGIIRGYQVGQDMFATLRPDRFNLEQWNSSQDVWQHIDFQIDDSGEEGGQYILFDEPVIRSSDLVVMVDGIPVFNAAPTFEVPEVKASLTFAADVFSYVKGSGTRDEVENVSGLNGEFIMSYGSAYTELPFADGETATEKADVIATSLLSRQYFHARGSFKRYPVPDATGAWPAGTQLTGMIDRVTVDYSDKGYFEVVDLTSERPRNYYVPERDLERMAKFRTLIPGQKELRQEANIARLTAAAIRTSPLARRTLGDAFRGIIGSHEPLHKVRISGSATTLGIGVPLWKLPNDTSGGNTVCVLPGSSGETHKEFAGVTVRKDEDSSTEISVQRTGDIFVRVMGPVSFGDVVRFSAGNDYLVVGGDSPAVGTSLQEWASASIRLIKVRTASSGGNGGDSDGITPRWG